MRRVAFKLSVKYPLVIFDSDGTLADTLPWMRAAYNDLAARHGLRIVTPEEEPQIRDLHGRELMKALHLPLWKLPAVMRDMRIRMTAVMHQFQKFPGIEESLRGLSNAGIRIAIVSSNSRANVEQVLGPDVSKLVHDFDCGASLFGKASKIKRVVRRAGVTRALYVGDEIRDAEASRSAGIAFGAVSWGHHRIELLRKENPDEVFATPADLAKQLI